MIWWRMVNRIQQGEGMVRLTVGNPFLSPFFYGDDCIERQKKFWGQIFLYFCQPNWIANRFSELVSDFHWKFHVFLWHNFEMQDFLKYPAIWIWITEIFEISCNLNLKSRKFSNIWTHMRRVPKNLWWSIIIEKIFTSFSRGPKGVCIAYRTHHSAYFRKVLLWNWEAVRRCCFLQPSIGMTEHGSLFLVPLGRSLHCVPTHSSSRKVTTAVSVGCWRITEKCQIFLR